jgi:predicted ester cyclase
LEKIMMHNHTANFHTTAFQYTPVDQEKNIAHKQRLIDIMHALVDSPLVELDDMIHDGYYAEAQVNVTHPLNELRSLEEISQKLWQPLRHAFPDVERRDDIVAGGRFHDANWIGCIGHYVGTFENDWLGIPATKGVIAVRYAEGHELRGGKIATSYIFIDFLDLIHQAGYWPIAPSLGREMQWLPPMTHDGVILSPQDNALSQASIERVLRMHAALGYYNGRPPTREVLDEMQMVKHWHPNFMWYGPAGIGTTRRLKGFEDYHQIPFLVAFPDRGGSDLGHFITIGDGHYAVTGGWGSLQATHQGNDFLGLPPTGKRVTMRVMDFYRCDGETIIENWIPFDIPHLLLQMGVDVFGRMRHQFRRHTRLSAGDWLVGTG